MRNDCIYKMPQTKQHHLHKTGQQDTNTPPPKQIPLPSSQPPPQEQEQNITRQKTIQNYSVATTLLPTVIARTNTATTAMTTNRRSGPAPLLASECSCIAETCQHTHLLTCRPPHTSILSILFPGVHFSCAQTCCVFLKRRESRVVAKKVLREVTFTASSLTCQIWRTVESVGSDQQTFQHLLCHLICANI